MAAKKNNPTKTDKDINYYKKTFWKIFGYGLLGVITFFLFASWGLFGSMPSFEDLENPDSNLATEIISSDGVVIGKYFQSQIRLRLFQALGEVHRQHVLAELLLLLGTLGVVEIFEVAEAHMARCQTQDHRRTFLLLAPHRGVGTDHAGGPRRRDVQRVQRFGGEELADRRTQNGATVPHA